MSNYFDLLSKKKKPHDVKSEWALVLERTPDEQVLPQTIQLMSEIFPLSKEEARDLVASTPIVLFDQLTLEIADQLKRKLNKSHIECSVTNDSFTKRKCFRAIWPETPNLISIISRFDSNGFTPKKEEPISTPTIMQEKISTVPLHPSTPVLSQTSVVEESFPAVTFDEQKELKQLILDLQKENEELRKQFDRLKPSIREEEQRRWNIEIQKLQADKGKFELKTKQMELERQAFLDQIKDLEGRLDRKLEHESSGQQTALNNWTELKKEFSRFRAVAEEEQRQAQKNMADLAQARQTMELDRQKLLDQIQHLEERNTMLLAQSKQVLEGTVKKTEEEKRALKSQIESLGTRLHQFEETRVVQVAQFQSELARLQNELLQSKNEKINLVEAERKIQNELKQVRSEWTLTQKEYEQARAEVEELKQMLDQIQGINLQIKDEAHKAKIEADRDARFLKADLEEWKKKAMDWSYNYANLVNEMERLRGSQTDDFENLKVKNKQLITQLEQAQRQNREFMEQIEQQDMIQKRLRAANEIAEKESRFRELQKKLEGISHEMSSKSQLAKDISTEITSLEEDMTKLKQTQKYITEQTKLKEKTKNGKTKILNPSIAPDDIDDKG